MIFKTKLKKSGLFSLNTLDIIKGVFITTVAEILYHAEALLVNYHIDPTIKFAIAIIASYLLKNFFTSDDKEVVASASAEDIGLPKPKP